MKTVVIYHRADFDGIFCREIAKKFLGTLDDTHYIGWDYGDPEPAKELIDGTGWLYILDLSVDSIMDHPNLIWIDHHKSAIEKYAKFPKAIPGYRIDGVAACRLAWQWFSINQHNAWNQTNEALQVPLPEKEAYVNRQVSEPFAIRLAGEYDIWDKRDPHADLFQHGLRSMDLTENIWNGLLDCSINETLHVQESQITAAHLLERGNAVQYSKTKENESIIKACGFTIEFEGFTLLVCNAARYNSQLFAAGLTPEHDGCLGFNWDGQQKIWRVSLYTDKPGIDLSPVAIKYGGGGHRGACGFRCKELPFPLA